MGGDGFCKGGTRYSALLTLVKEDRVFLQNDNGKGERGRDRSYSRRRRKTESLTGGQQPNPRLPRNCPGSSREESCSSFVQAKVRRLKGFFRTSWGGRRNFCEGSN